MAAASDFPDGLVAIPAGHLFGTNTTRIALKRGVYLRNFVYAFAQYLSSKLTQSAIDKAMRT
jgi:LysR family cys regulon transcriptional activator